MWSSIINTGVGLVSDLIGGGNSEPDTPKYPPMEEALRYALKFPNDPNSIAFMKKANHTMATNPNNQYADMWHRVHSELGIKNIYASNTVKNPPIQSNQGGGFNTSNSPEPKPTSTPLNSNMFLYGAIGLGLILILKKK